MPRVRRPIALLALALCVCAASASAQTPVTLAQAITAASSRGSRVSLSAADTTAARARLFGARLWSDPSLSAKYSRAVPNFHTEVALPLDAPWIRRLRVRAAERDADAVRLRFALDAATSRLEMTRAYARAAALAAHAELSRRTWTDADSLLRMTRFRQVSGDASTLDVELARINGGQLAARAAEDSLAAIVALLEVQRLIALPADTVVVSLADSLPTLVARGGAVSTEGAEGGAGPIAGTGAAHPLDQSRGQPGGQPLSVAIAQRTLDARSSALALERRRTLGVPALAAGFETGDPANHGLLPTIGIALHLPLLNGNRGAVAVAAAERDRAAVELAIARRESAAALAAARRERTLALARVERGRELVASADRVATLSLVAYHEGEVALPYVLERSATRARSATATWTISRRS